MSSIQTENCRTVIEIMDSQQKDAPVEKVEEPPELTPPDAELVTPRRGSLMLLLLVALTIFIVLDLAILAYFLLPGKKEEKQPPPQKSERLIGTAREPQGVAKVEENEIRTREISSEIRDRWLQMQAVAEADGIADWGGQPFTVIRETVAQAERLMAEQQYGRAAAGYRKAISKLQALQASRPKMLEEALSAGAQALVDGDGSAAITSFTRALALDSANVAARRGLERAKNIDQVKDLYAKALAAEQQGQLKSAEDLLGRIRALDTQFQPAVQALFRVRGQIQEQEFNVLMAGFLQALAEKQEKTARSYLIRAEKLRPHSALVVQGKRQLRQMVVEQSLARLQAQYRQAVAAEQWERAGDFCLQALQVDSQAAFALAGLEKAQQRLALEKAMLAIVNNPLRLQEKGVRTQAGQTLAAARSVRDTGPQLRKQITDVDALLAASGRQVDVVLQSDNATEIIIYRVGRMGRFSRKTVRLRPGRYTVVGSRAGYRDVRREFEVRPGRKPPLLQIRCTEVI